MPALCNKLGMGLPKEELNSFGRVEKLLSLRSVGTTWDEKLCPLIFTCPDAAPSWEPC